MPSVLDLLKRHQAKVIEVMQTHATNKKNDKYLINQRESSGEKSSGSKSLFSLLHGGEDWFVMGKTEKENTVCALTERRRSLLKKIHHIAIKKTQGNQRTKILVEEKTYVVKIGKYHPNDNLSAKFMQNDFEIAQQLYPDHFYAWFTRVNHKGYVKSYFIQPYFGDVNLENVFDLKLIPSVKQRLILMLEVTKNFLAMHALQLIWVDGKPSNIMFLEKEKEIKVVSVDFELAAKYNEVMNRRGTRGSSAPEIWDPNYKADFMNDSRLIVSLPEFDYYSLGMMLWQFINEKLLSVNDRNLLNALTQAMRSEKPFSRPGLNEAREVLEKISQNVDRFTAFQKKIYFDMVNHLLDRISLEPEQTGIEENIFISEMMQDLVHIIYEFGEKVNECISYDGLSEIGLSDLTLPIMSAVNKKTSSVYGTLKEKLANKFTNDLCHIIEKSGEEMHKNYKTYLNSGYNFFQEATNKKQDQNPIINLEANKTEFSIY